MLRITLLALLFAAGCPASDWLIGILDFNSPKRLTLEAEPGARLRLIAGTRRIDLNHGSTIGLLAAGSDIDVFAQRTGSTSRNVQITGTNGGPAAFSIRDGLKRRRYMGTLDVAAMGGTLFLKCRVPDEVVVAIALATLAPKDGEPELRALAATVRERLASSRGRHHGFDFCDRAHCGFQSDPPREGSAHFSAARAGDPR
jgi:hypothetical protein